MRNFKAQGQARSMGLEDFTKVEIEEHNNDSMLTVTNVRKNRPSFDYLILVQDIQNGYIGVIDPEIENEQ